MNLQNCLKSPPEDQFSAKLLEANLFPMPLQAPIQLDACRNKIVPTNGSERHRDRRPDGVRTL